jgi:hypothetical protein
MNLTETLVAAAVSGLLVGVSGCAKNEKPPSSPAGMSPMPSTGAKHACKGQNNCKGQGGCKTDKNACKGQNSCKGQGGCQTT